MVKDHSLLDQSLPDSEKDTDFEKCFVKIPYADIDSKWFAKHLSKLIKGLFGIELRILFVTFKINRHF